ncbi:MAG: ABC transporter permease [Thermoplasmata archaeon]|nr:ABC transporter permease [Thermoplasmata archaeon]
MNGTGGLLFSSLLEDWRHTILSARHDIKKHLRRKRIYIALFLAVMLPLLFGIIYPLASIPYPDMPEDFLRNALGFVNIFVIVVVALFAGDTISGEFETRTCYSVFPLPQNRESIFLGKHISSLLISGVMVSLFYLVLGLESLSIYGSSGVTVEFLDSYLVAILYTGGAVGVAVFFSGILSRGVQSTLVTFFMLFIILPVVQTVLMIASVEPWFILTYNGDLIQNVYGAAPVEIPGLFTITVPDYEKGVWVIMCYATVLPFIGVALAKGREVR